MFGPKKQINSVYSSPDNGHFALEDAETNNMNWDHCREQFAPKFPSHLPGFFFSHPTNKSREVAELVLKTEQILGITSFKTPYETTKFSLTNKSNILWVEPSWFWRECWMKRSAFTILLRCGMLYDLERQNYEEALFIENTVRIDKVMTFNKTKPAFQRFLYGFTRYVGPEPARQEATSVQKEGWHSVFSVLNMGEIKQNLLSPEGVDFEPCFIGLDTLWS